MPVDHRTRTLEKEGVTIDVEPATDRKKAWGKTIFPARGRWVAHGDRSGECRGIQPGECLAPYSGAAPAAGDVDDVGSHLELRDGRATTVVGR